MKDDKGGFVTGGYTGRSGLGDGEVAGIVTDPASWALGESICDPLQDAITSTEIACRTAQGEALVALQGHLIRLLDLQYARLTGMEE